METDPPLNYRLLFFLVLSTAILIISCEKEETTLYSSTPSIEATDIRSGDAEFSVLYDTGVSGEIVSCGVVWSKKENPTLENNDGYTVDRGRTGSFKSIVTDLDPGATYFVRAYVIFTSDTIYSDQLMIITSKQPSVNTLEVSGITSTSAISGGNVTSDGGTQVTGRGLVWGTSAMPSLERNEGMMFKGKGTGRFEAAIKGLTASKKYYLRAFATNEAGTAYGNQVSFLTNVTAVDIDGNVYRSINIGGQVWMAQNLRVTRYSNGDMISADPADPEWQKSGESDLGSYTVYPHTELDGLGSDAEVVEEYGALYNWHAVDDDRGLCPTGWRVPDAADWQELIDHLGGPEIAGGRLKSAETAPAYHPRWDNPNTGATNESGFSALPGGSRTSDGNYGLAGYHGYWWSATEINVFGAGDIMMGCRHNDVISSIGNKENNYSVRCIMDAD